MSVAVVPSGLFASYLMLSNPAWQIIFAWRRCLHPSFSDAAAVHGKFCAAPDACRCKSCYVCSQQQRLVCCSRKLSMYSWICLDICLQHQLHPRCSGHRGCLALVLFSVRDARHVCLICWGHPASADRVRMHVCGPRRSLSVMRN